MSNATPPLRRILVVDDVPDNVGVLFDFLEQHGCKLFVFEDAALALRALSEIAPDLILLDVMMPGMDGFEACRHIRADARHDEVPVFFMTALGEPVDRVRGLQAGAADYITKPLFPEEVLARIRVHLDLRDRTRELLEQNEKLDAARQRQLQTERSLHELLDRAVLVADPDGQVRFVAAAAERLLRRYFPPYAAGPLPPEIRAWLSRPEGGTLRANRGDHRLELTCAPVRDPAASRLVYIDEHRPQPQPAQLQALGLTPREAEILFWIAQGKTSPEIAIIVGSATATVRKHVENITAKLGVESRLAAALKARDILEAK